jgi:two-component system sensor histidine kinase SenX3
MAKLKGRSLARHLAELASKIDGSPVGHDENAVRVLARLEAAIDRLSAQGADAVRVCERLAVAADHVSEGVVICDEAGEVVFRNTLAEAYAGARHGDALVERTMAELLADALKGRAGREQLDLWGPPRRAVILSAVPLQELGRTVGAVAVVEDVSERLRLEAMRRDFVANISHELKTPVGAVAILAETLAGEDDPTVTRRLAGRMQVEAERLGRIIEDLLDLSRIEAEEGPVREPVAVQAAVGQAVDRLQGLADLRRIHLEVGVDHEAAVLGDVRQLVSAVHNLLENAVKYSDSGSTVRVEVGTDDGKVAVVVVDHGIGIPERDLGRIFERFYRVDRARARDTGGTGLGLAIVRHVAYNHGGHVSVVSKEGEGSTFTLQLPAAPTRSRTLLPASPQPSAT